MQRLELRFFRVHTCYTHDIDTLDTISHNILRKHLKLSHENCHDLIPHSVFFQLPLGQFGSEKRNIVFTGVPFIVDLCTFHLRVVLLSNKVFPSNLVEKFCQQHPCSPNQGFGKSITTTCCEENHEFCIGTKIL